MDKKFFNEVSPLIKNMPAWKALLALLEHQKSKAVDKLVGTPSADELFRISGELNAIAKLEKMQDVILNAEKNI